MKHCVVREIQNQTLWVFRKIRGQTLWVFAILRRDPLELTVLCGFSGNVSHNYSYIISGKVSFKGFVAT